MPEPTDTPLMTVEDIQKVIPHRYPFLLVDKVLSLEEGKRIVAVKNVTVNEPFFPGHFPGHPIMPGVLIVEALAQTAGILLLRGRQEEGKAPVFMAIDETRFRSPVKPGDVLRLEVEILRHGATFSKAQGKAYVGDRLAVEAVFMAGLIEKDRL